MLIDRGADGLATIDMAGREDARGGFIRVFCAERFAQAGLPTAFPQMNFSTNRRRGTLRGLHFQAGPMPEGKLVRCLRGAVFDVALDLRPESPGFGRWRAMILSAANGRAVFIPAGFAHGFQTLEDDSALLYAMTAPYSAALARGVAWDDPALAIDWPVAAPVISQRDAALPRLAQLLLAQTGGIA
jgi:dTDP-4-dehydrorhamnose 3,5-epimerase